MKVIGAVGRIGSGKDTILGIIAKKEHCKLVSFGDMTRELAKK
jgi:dephospho-CoA kinase